jgi:hypothetical protein
LEIALREGADDAIFAGGTGINRQRHTRTAVDLVGETIAGARTAVPSRRIVDAAVERGVDAQITADLDAGVGVTVSLPPSRNDELLPG